MWDMIPSNVDVTHEFICVCIFLSHIADFESCVWRVCAPVTHSYGGHDPYICVTHECVFFSHDAGFEGCACVCVCVNVCVCMRVYCIMYIRMSYVIYMYGSCQAFECTCMCMRNALCVCEHMCAYACIK